MTGSASSGMRMWGYCLLLSALAFVQSPGLIVADTKFDLVADPVEFLRRATTMWDPLAAFGQVQNQAYGYFWPMGPFFALGDLAAVPDWVVQRLWWSLLLCLAFVGVVRVARALQIGVPWTQVTAGFAYALSVHLLTLLGPTSVEAWPSALVPWVLLPLVRATQGGSVRRGAALAALAVAMAGGVNAVAVSALLPLGVAWLVTRRPGARTWALLGWWAVFTVLATLWWVVPLLLLGRYSVPFLDYIENAPITTLTTSLPDVLGGSSDWVAYVDPQNWGAGHLLATTPVLLVNAAVLAAVGLTGLSRRDMPHRHFLFLGLLLGVALVTFGYTGPLSGWASGERQDLLDGVLAPFRNLHKFDAVVRLPLVLGLAHFLAVVRPTPVHLSDRVVRVAAVGAVVVSIAGLAVPVYAGRVAPSGGFARTPEYWHEVADYLARNHDGGVALEVPASAFGDYWWGSPHDDVLQPYARAPWAVRNVIPLAQPGNVRMLDAVTRSLEMGRPDSRLAPFLAAAGVSRLVVRNDLDLGRTGAPDPVVLHQALDRSPGLVRVAEFGPMIGRRAVSYTETGVRVLLNRGRQDRFASVEVYAVRPRGRRVSAWPVETVPVVAGDPGAGLSVGGEDLAGPKILAGDRSPDLDGPLVLTDGLRRKETAFTAVRANQSSTLGRDDPWTLDSVEPNHRLYTDQEAWETVEAWDGIVGVDASSAQSNANAIPPIRSDQGPASVLDGDPSSAWVSAASTGAVGQWWEVDLEQPRRLRAVELTAGPAVGPRVTRWRLTTRTGSYEVAAPRPGRSRRYSLPAGRSSFLRVEAVAVKGGGPGVQATLADVELPGVAAVRRLAAPSVPGAAPDRVYLERDRGRPACATVQDTEVCDDLWVSSGEEGKDLRRVVPLPESATYLAELRAGVRDSRAAVRAIAAALPLRVRSSDPLSRDVRASALAAVDGDPDTAWVSDGSADPYLSLSWDEAVEIDRLEARLATSTPAARPERVELVAPGVRRTVKLEDGAASFSPFTTDRVLIRFRSSEPAYSFEGPFAVRLPVGVGEVTFPGSGVPANRPRTGVDLGCGSGPRLYVNGTVRDTRLSGRFGRLMSGEALPTEICGGRSVWLRDGDNVVDALATGVAVPWDLRLDMVPSARDTESAPAARVPVEVSTWSPVRREVAVAARSDSVLLVVSENLNSGWTASLEGEVLPAQRVDGWRQGWLVPPGDRDVVTIEYRPDVTYRIGLLAGAGSALVVVLAALVPARRRPLRPIPASRRSGVLLAASAVTVGGLAGGWLGAGAVLAGLVLVRAFGTPGWLGPLGGAFVAAGGVASGLARLEGFVPYSTVAQLLALLGLGLASAAAVANGPAFLSLRNGRSSR